MPELKISVRVRACVCVCVCVRDISVRLTFILTWRNALLLFRICNLCYNGRVVHGNEMLCTFGYTVLFLGKHYQAYYSPLAVHRLESPLCAPLKSHFTRSMQSHSPGAYKQDEMSARGSGHGASRIWGDSPRCAGAKQSVSPALKSCVSAVVVAGSIAPRLLLLLLLLLYAPASVHTPQYQLRDTVTVFTQRWRPSSCHRAMQAHYNNTPSTFLLSLSGPAEKRSQSAHRSLFVGVLILKAFQLTQEAQCRFSVCFHVIQNSAKHCLGS